MSGFDVRSLSFLLGGRGGGEEEGGTATRRLVTVWWQNDHAQYVRNFNEWLNQRCSGVLVPVANAVNVVSKNVMIP